jgi:hypothetical protein
MSESCTIVCLDCRKAGPSIGDYGFLGWPSMDERPTEPADEQWEWLARPFGYIRRVFLDMGICTDELEHFAAFMRQHDGHYLGIASEGRLQHDDDNGQEIVSAIERSHQIEQPLSYKELQERAVDGFVVGKYSLQCSCGASHLAAPSTILKPLPETLWTPNVLARLRDLLTLETDFWRTTDPLLDPGEAGGQPLSDLRQIEAFVTAHLRHGVLARVVPG